jgi:predicted dinucleotide-binding enzyme
MRLVDRLGFDPVDAGSLENGVKLEPDGSPHAPTCTADELRDRIDHLSISGESAAARGYPIG